MQQPLLPCHITKSRSSCRPSTGGTVGEDVIKTQELELTHAIQAVAEEPHLLFSVLMGNIFVLVLPIQSSMSASHSPRKPLINGVRGCSFFV